MRGIPGPIQVDLTRGLQAVHAFLPVRSYGLRVAVQGDWAVSSSREAILHNNEWNEWLVTKLPLALLAAVETCKKDPALAMSLFLLFGTPSEVLGLFRPAVTHFFHLLRRSSCVYTTAGDWVLPTQAVVGAEQARRLLGPAGELSSHAANAGIWLVHAGIETSAMLEKQLGVRKLQVSDISHLVATGVDTPCTARCRSILRVLEEILRGGKVADRTLALAQGMAILPLVDGRVLASRDGVFIPSDLASVPTVLLRELPVLDKQLVEGASTEDDDGIAEARISRMLQL